MRLILLIWIIMLPWFAGAQSVLTLEGHYMGENLYVQNPYVSDSVFCTDSIYVNGKKTNDITNANAYEVMLKDKGLKPYDPVVVKIYHKAGCSPGVIPGSTAHHNSYIHVEHISIDSTGLLKWTTKNDSTIHKIIFSVEQYVWNKWITVGEVQQEDIKQTAFSFQATLHADENKFRVKYSTMYGKTYPSKTIVIKSNLVEVTFQLALQVKQLLFSRETRYEIYDSSGHLLKHGFGKVADIGNLKKGKYFLNYDNKTDEIKIR